MMILKYCTLHVVTDFYKFFVIRSLFLKRNFQKSIDVLMFMVNIGKLLNIEDFNTFLCYSFKRNVQKSDDVLKFFEVLCSLFFIL